MATRRPHAPQKVRLAIEKQASTLSPIKLFDVKQARAALATSRYRTQSETDDSDSDLAEFLTALGANLFARASLRPPTSNIASLLTISDRRKLVPALKKVHHLRSGLDCTADISVPRHVVPSSRLLVRKEHEKKYGTIQSALLDKKKENVERMKREARINTQERILSRIPIFEAFSFRVKREKQLFIQSELTKKLLETDLSEMKSRIKIIVIGAGLAGLSAADHLLSLGFREVVVLEALDRVGGRVHSVQYGDQPTQLVEMGAACVDHTNDDNSLYNLVKEFGISEESWKDDRYNSIVLSSKGTPLRTKVVSFMTLPRKLLQVDSLVINSQIKSKYRENINLAYDDYIRERQRRFFHNNNNTISSRFEDVCQKVNKLAFSSKFQLGDNNGDLAVHLLDFYQDKDLQKVVLPTGMAALLEPLTSRLRPNHIRLNARVQRVEWQTSYGKGQPNGKITCSDGRIFHAQHVIITIPLGHLKKNADKLFVPALPAEKMDAIRRVGFGTIAKVYLCYDAPVWPKPVNFIWPGCEKVTEKLWSESLKFTSSELHPKVLEVSMLGSTVEQMLDSDITYQLTTILSLFLGANPPQPVRILKTSWFSNPMFLGTHPYLSTQCSEKDVTILEEPLMFEDIPVVLFAGDYTYNTYRCLTDAARASGLREARRLNHLYNTLYHYENTNP